VNWLAPPNPSLDEQFQVGWAGSISIEAIREGVFEPFQRKMRSAARIRPIEERTVLSAIRRLHHKSAQGVSSRRLNIG
jgi:hypothetical protein